MTLAERDKLLEQLVECVDWCISVVVFSSDFSPGRFPAAQFLVSSAYRSLVCP